MPKTVNDSTIINVLRDMRAETTLDGTEFTAEKVAAKLGIKPQTLKKRMEVWETTLTEKFGAEVAAKRIPQFDRKKVKIVRATADELNDALEALYRGIENAANDEEPANTVE